MLLLRRLHRSSSHRDNTIRSLATRKKTPTTTTTTAYKAPAVRLPTLDYLQGISDDWNLELEEEELKDLQGCMRHTVAAYARVDELATAATSSSLAPQFPRLPGGTRPAPEDNPFNAWYLKTDIKGTSRAKGLLHGKTVAVKDTIAVAGVPMMNGSRILEGYTPEFDATVVTRVIEAGGTIAGKACAEDLCCSASSFATALGPVRNPWNEKHAAGGSSSGCGALVGGGVVDMALGTDQGGSIRIPAAWCGCVGLKPTFGLVPYTGIASHEFTLDHVGPMARTVQDAALLLEAIAGADPEQRDARQPPNLARVPRYAKAATGDIKGLRIGVVAEGLENCQSDVKEHTLAVAGRLRQAGAQVEEVSIPLHKDSAAIWLPLCLEGGHATRMDGERGYRGHYPVSLSQAYFRGFRLQAAELSYTNKFYVLFGEYVKENYGPLYYQKCQNMVPRLTAAYDAVLASGVDALLLPTAPIKPLPLPQEGMTAAECIAQAWGALQNTAAFDLTGHPALSVNAGFSSDGDNLPIGVQVVARRWDDAMALNVGRAIELGRAGDTPGKRRR